MSSKRTVARSMCVANRPSPSPQERARPAGRNPSGRSTSLTRNLKAASRTPGCARPRTFCNRGGSCGQIHRNAEPMPLMRAIDVPRSARAALRAAEFDRLGLAHGHGEHGRGGPAFAGGPASPGARPAAFVSVLVSVARFGGALRRAHIRAARSACGRTPRRPRTRRPALAPIGPAREDDRHLRAQRDAGELRAAEVFELLGQHVARLQVRHDEDVGHAGHARREILDRGRLALTAVSNASGPSRIAPTICFRSAILQRAAASRST